MKQVFRRNMVGLQKREVHPATLSESIIVLHGKPQGGTMLFNSVPRCVDIVLCPAGSQSIIPIHDQIILTRKSFSMAGTLLAFNCLAYACTKVANSLQGAGISQDIKETERTKVSSKHRGGWKGLSYHSGIFTEVFLAGSPNCCRWKQCPDSW